MKCEEKLEEGLNISALICVISIAGFRAITAYTKKERPDLNSAAITDVLNVHLKFGFSFFYRVHFHGDLVLSAMLSHCKVFQVIRSVAIFRILYNFI